MYYSKQYALILSLLILMPHHAFSAFAQGTLVKTPRGMVPIETLRVNDTVFSYKDNTIIENHILKIFSLKSTDGYILQTASACFYASSNQRLYDPITQQWISACGIKSDAHFINSARGPIDCIACRATDQETACYDIALAEPHNFFISDDEILVHNFTVIAVIPALLTSKFIAECMTLAVAFITLKFLNDQDKKGAKQKDATPSSSPSPSIDPEDPKWKKKHPHGKYEDAGYHHANSKGVKNPSPRNGQRALDNSLKVETVNSPHRISIDNGEFVVLKQTSPGLFHGYTCSWVELSSYMQNTLRNAKLVTPKGKIVP